MFCFVKLAIKWPAIMLQWDTVEKQLPAMKTQNERGKLSKEIRIISIILITLSLGMCSSCVPTC